MGDVVEMWSDRRKAEVPRPKLLDDFLHHMRTFHNTDMAPQGQVGEPWTSPAHELMSRASLLHQEHHKYHESFRSRMTPHDHQAE